MYPKPLQDLSGWNVRSVGCSVTSIVVAADESVIAWGPSPTYGELVIYSFYIHLLNFFFFSIFQQLIMLVLGHRRNAAQFNRSNGSKNT